MHIRIPAPILSLMHVYASRWKKPRVTAVSYAPIIAPMTTTKIDGRPVPIEPGSKTIISFSAGRRGPDEAGKWEFWTLMGPAGAAVIRCQEGADPGESFCRMTGQGEHASPWRKSRFTDHLHPATIDELESWMNTHPECVPHAKTGELGGAKVRVVKEGRRYQVVLDEPWLRLAMPRGIPARLRGIAR
jgi:hypothetical protein